mgnify:CR=1 FL=1
MKFEGTKSYIATEDLKVAVNASILFENKFCLLLLNYIYIYVIIYF